MCRHAFPAGLSVFFTLGKWGEAVGASAGQKVLAVKTKPLCPMSALPSCAVSTMAGLSIPCQFRPTLIKPYMSGGGRHIFLFFTMLESLRVMLRPISFSLSAARACSGVGPRLRAATNSAHTSGGNVLIGCRAMRPASTVPAYIATGLRGRLNRRKHSEKAATGAIKLSMFLCPQHTMPNPARPTKLRKRSGLPAGGRGHSRLVRLRQAHRPAQAGAARPRSDARAAGRLDQARASARRGVARAAAELLTRPPGPAAWTPTRSWRRSPAEQ